MAISYTQQRTNVPAPVAQLSSLGGRSHQQPYAVGGVPPSSDLLLRLWSVIQRLEDEVDVERERNRTLTTQVDSLADRLAASNTLLATLSGMSTTNMPSTLPTVSASSFITDSNVPVVAAPMEGPSKPSYRSVVTGGSNQQQPSASPTITETTFPDHGVPLWHVLRSLSNIDEKRVFTVRKIQKLGFESPPKLREYFSLWGQVINILVLHRQARTTSSCSSGDMSNDKNVRVRPPSVGFVVMEDPEVVTRILATPQHTICGHSCEVQVFERKHKHSTVGESYSLSETSTISSGTSPMSSPASGNNNMIGIKDDDDEDLPAFMRELRSGSMAMAEIDLLGQEKGGHLVAPTRAYSTGFDTTPDTTFSSSTSRRFTTSSLEPVPSNRALW